MTRIHRSELLYWIAFAVLAAAALVLGYLILRPQISAFLAEHRAKAPSSAETPVIATDQADRDAIRQTPEKNSPSSTKAAYFEVIKRLGKDTDSVDLSGCLSNPIVARVKLGSTVTITNKDSSPHQLQINPEHTYTIPAKGSLPVKVDFGFGAGWYGYGCDSSNGAAGVFWVGS
jgi:hypothetical protein